MKKSQIAMGGIILLAFLSSFYFYPQLPENLASHWNARGEVDGYMPKALMLFIMPFILLGLTLLFTILPKLDPLRKNLEEFRGYYDGFLILLSLFLLIIHWQSILWNLGIKISPNLLLPPALGVLFFYIGVLCEKSRQNWFVGIRTPWTLSSEKVWDKTHQLGGKLFKLSGPITALGVFLPRYAMFFIVVPVILVSISTTVYSYLEYKKENR